MKQIKRLISLLIIAPLILAGSCEQENAENTPPPPPPVDNIDVDVYLTRPDKSALFELQEEGPDEVNDNGLPGIIINPDNAYQQIEGFGYTLTGGSAKLLSELSATQRNNILTELFDTSSNAIGVSYLRVSLGASDLDEYTFSYNSTDGDVEMKDFDLGYDKKYLIPVLKEILAINPEITLLAAPWSAPVWMKTNNNTVGGSLKTRYYDAYALYFVKYIKAMAAEGINIDAVTVQNEPLHGGNNPSMEMTAIEQANFIKQSLGPAFEDKKLETKIIIYDHNADRTDYPISILNDAEAAKYIHGSAFHLYGGNIGALTSVHNAHPTKGLYFTEQWIGAPGNFAEDLKWHMREVIIGSTRNWCSIALEWNLAADANLQPHTEGGCTQCLGALTIDNGSIVRNPAYYIIAHAAKFIRPGSVRIQSNYLNDLPNVAFQTPNGDIILIVLNNSYNTKNFNVTSNEVSFSSSLVSGAVVTMVINK